MHRPSPISFALDTGRSATLRGTGMSSHTSPLTTIGRSGASQKDAHANSTNVAGGGVSARQWRRASVTTRVASSTSGWQRQNQSTMPNQQQLPQALEAALRKWSNAAADRKQRLLDCGHHDDATTADDDATSMLLDLRPDHVSEALNLFAEGDVDTAVNVLFDATCIAENADFVSDTIRSLLRVVIGFAASATRSAPGVQQDTRSTSKLDTQPPAANETKRAESTTTSLQSLTSLNPAAAANPFRRVASVAATNVNEHASPATWQAHAAARQLASRGGFAGSGGAHESQTLAQFIESPGAGWTSRNNHAGMDASADELPNASMASVVSLAIAAPQHTNVAAVGEEMDDGTSELNQYVLLQPVGRGKQGEVFLAMDTEKNELRAIKVVKRPKGAASGPSAGGPLARARDRQRQQLEREVAIMKRCRHRNVVALYEVIDDPELDCMYLVMQYVEHGPLVKVQRDGTADRTLSPAALAGYARQLCSGLLYLHKHGVIHRDIKPDNILLGQNDQVYLADFGMAEVFDEGAMTTSNNVHGTRGTIAFMAPELLSTTESTAVEGEAVDVWALGITFYVLLFGRLPWEFTDLRSLLHKIETVPVKFPSPPEGAHSLSRQNVRSVPVDDGSLNAAPPPHPPAHGDPAHSAGPLVRAATAATVSLDAATKPRVTFGTPELLPDSAVCEAASSSDFTPPAISEDDDDDEYVFEATRRRSSHRQDNDNSHSRTRATRTKPAGRPATRYSVSEIRARPYRCGWRPIIAGMLERAPADRTPLATVRRQVASLHAALREHGDAPVGTDVGVCPTAFFSDGGAARHHYGSITAVRRTSFAAARIEY